MHDVFLLQDFNQPPLADESACILYNSTKYALQSEHKVHIMTEIKPCYRTSIHGPTVILHQHAKKLTLAACILGKQQLVKTAIGHRYRALKSRPCEFLTTAFGFGGTHSEAMYFFCSYLDRMKDSSPLPRNVKETNNCPLSYN